VQTNGNPLTNMMARNLKVFLKIYAEIKRKSKNELENLSEALHMDQKMAELEK
jgi:orotate phosphoribosyltransferase-like protein